MSYDIGASPNGDYVILRIRGEINRRIAMARNQEAHAFARALGVNRFLVDVTEARNTDSVLDQYRFAYEDMQHSDGIDRTSRAAVLVAVGDHSHDFIETAARNAGLAMRLFTDRDAALAYLRAP